MKVLILGATGQLGSALCSVLATELEVIAATRKEFDITDLTATRSFILATEPDVVINPAAYTDVDGCEKEREKAFLVNAIGARNVAIAAREVGAKLVHISTDYVFDGSKDGPYVEYDPPHPLNVYGWSKLMGEQMVREQNPRSFILRVAWLYSSSRKNFVKTMLRLAMEREEIRVVSDQRGTPTFVGDVAQQIKLLIETDYYGLYHCTSQGSCTRYEFAKEIFRLAGVPVKVVPVTSAEFPTPARRPPHSVLENFLLKVQGLDIMPHWKESLAAQIQRIKEAVENEGSGPLRR
ncbi:MAG: dTDP-4-dehydrorhamnose reductase [Thaumarchaeota archaeon]|nr:MAG: dTDP-4-dehydrorhamnose reductase [Nitrososphaerota archaeon]